jgi:hypothetical protein
MDFLEDLLLINNTFQLEKIAKERDLNQEETESFIKKYNKSNNRSFTPCKKYMINEYKEEVDKYNLVNDA